MTERPAEFNPASAVAPEKRMKLLGAGDGKFSPAQAWPARAKLFGSLPVVSFRKIFRRKHESKNHHHPKKGRP
jgi:hypothetical protein